MEAVCCVVNDDFLWLFYDFDVDWKFMWLFYDFDVESKCLYDLSWFDSDRMYMPCENEVNNQMLIISYDYIYHVLWWVFQVWQEI